MAAENEMRVIFGADGKPLSKTLAELESDLKAFQKQLQNASDPTAIIGLNKSLLLTKKNMDAIKGAGVNPFRGLTAGSGEAAQSMQNLGRIAQDVPFGFIGIQNNLNPLLESFARLKAETGSTGKALKAMGSSLIGVGGLGLALSVVSAAILIYQNGIMGFNKKTKEAADTTKNFIDSLKSIADITSDSTASVQGQIVVIQAYAAAAQDATKSDKERKRALDELHQINKAVFGDTTLQADSLAKLTGKVEEHTKALIANAVVSGFTDEIKRVTGELATQQRELRRLITSYAALKEAGKVQPDDIIAESGINFSRLKREKAAAEKLGISASGETVVGNIKEQSKAVDTLKTAYADLADSIKSAIGVSLGLIDLKPLPTPKTSIEKIAKEVEIEIKPTFLFGTVDIAKLLEPIKNQFSVAAQFPKIKIEVDKELLDRELKESERIIKQFNTQLQTTIANLGESLASSIGEAIGSVFSGSAFNPVGAFLTLIGDTLMQLGKAAISAGIQMLFLKKALALLIKNPATAIIAGVALVAAGAAIKSSVNKIPKFAQGGLVTGPTIGLIGEAGPEMVIPLNKMGNMFNDQNQKVDVEVYGKISNDVIVLSNKRGTESLNRRF